MSYVKIRVKGQGVVPRGNGLAPILAPFKVHDSLLRIIMDTPGLKPECQDPSDPTMFIEVNRENFVKVIKDYNCDVFKKPVPPVEEEADIPYTEGTNDTTATDTTATDTTATDTTATEGTNEGVTTESNSYTFSPMNKDDVKEDSNIAATKTSDESSNETSDTNETKVEEAKSKLPEVKDSTRYGHNYPGKKK